MKFVIDMNLSPAWVPVFVALGHEAVHWGTVGDFAAPDTEIMRWAREHGHVVFTHDLDYGALLYATAATAPSVVQIRSEDVRPGTLSDCVKNALLACERDIAAGALVTIDPRRWRITLLPLAKNY